MKWKTLSADDGDPANGQFTFTYDPSKPAATGTEVTRDTGIGAAASPTSTQLRARQLRGRWWRLRDILGAGNGGGGWNARGGLRRDVPADPEAAMRRYAGLLIALMLIGVVALRPDTALGHAALVRADPAPNSFLQKPPTQISLSASPRRSTSPTVACASSTPRARRLHFRVRRSRAMERNERSAAGAEARHLQRHLG